MGLAITKSTSLTALTHNMFWLKIKYVILQGAMVLCQGWGCCHAIATLSSRHSSEQLCAVAKTLRNFTLLFPGTTMKKSHLN